MPDQTAVVPFDPQKLALALKRVSREAVPLASFLKMDKSGEWCFGVNADPIPERQQFYLNPNGFQHGWVCWSDPAKSKVAEKLGETIAAITEQLPENGPVPLTGRGWEYQLGVSLKGCGGALDGQEFVYRVSSVGGKRAIAGLADLVATRLEAGAGGLVPVVALDSDSYVHKQYGRIHIPVIDIVKWMAMPKDGAAPAEPVKQAARAKAAKALVEERKPNGKRR